MVLLFCGSFMLFLSCACFALMRVCLLIHCCHLLTSWLSFMMSNCELVTFLLISCVRCDIWLYRLLIFALFLTLLVMLIVLWLFSHVVSWVRCGTWLYCCLIFAVFLILPSSLPSIKNGCNKRCTGMDVCLHLHTWYRILHACSCFIDFY